MSDSQKEESVVWTVDISNEKDNQNRLPFLEMLYRILERSDDDPKFSKLIYWNKEGTEFFVPDRNKFENTILIANFWRPQRPWKFGIYPHFLAELTHFYGFEYSEGKGEQIAACRHPLFTRHNRDKSIKIARSRKPEPNIFSRASTEHIHRDELMPYVIDATNNPVGRKGKTTATGTTTAASKGDEPTASTENKKKRSVNKKKRSVSSTAVNSAETNHNVTTPSPTTTVTSKSFFLAKLREILDRSRSDPSLSQIISWKDGGTKFEIYDVLEFSRTFPSWHFIQKGNNKNKIGKSFYRQLEFFGFDKVEHKCCYHHPEFTWNVPSLPPRPTPSIIATSTATIQNKVSPASSSTGAPKGRENATMAAAKHAITAIGDMQSDFVTDRPTTNEPKKVKEAFDVPLDLDNVDKEQECTQAETPMQEDTEANSNQAHVSSSIEEDVGSSSVMMRNKGATKIPASDTNNQNEASSSSKGNGDDDQNNHTIAPSGLSSKRQRTKQQFLVSDTPTEHKKKKQKTNSMSMPSITKNSIAGESDGVDDKMGSRSGVDGGVATDESSVVSVKVATIPTAAVALQEPPQGWMKYFFELCKEEPTQLAQGLVDASRDDATQRNWLTALARGILHAVEHETNVDPMDMEFVSPYRNKYHAEATERSFSLFNDLISKNASQGMIKRRDEIFGSSLGNKLALACPQIQKLGRLFSPVWRETYGIPDEILLLCLDSRKLDGADPPSLKNVVQEFDLWNLLVDILDDWGLDSPQYFQVLGLKINKEEWCSKSKMDLQCLLFVCRAYRCMQVLKWTQIQGSMAHKVQRCLQILQERCSPGTYQEQLENEYLNCEQTYANGDEQSTSPCGEFF